jgi:hypothetical protein
VSARGILAYALERSSGECGPPALAIGLVLINFAAFGWITASSDHGSFNASATVMHEIMLMNVPPCHSFVQQMYRVDRCIVFKCPSTFTSGKVLGELLECRIA